ncbi:Homeobox-leucine zipper protein ANTHOCYANINLESS 2 [Zea mays]|uniref:Homeobox-leucine zipper protein ANTHOCYANINLESS 2 n=1 Tax=Zea mays TaxID=4577 RepID=A0A1D6MN23_MAIZE|nr:Homeobox-leucine zipper protein ANTHOCYANINLESS 2 [Zea mays]
MSFGSLFDGGSGGGGGGGGMQFPFSTGFSSSPALSLGLENPGGGMVGRMLPVGGAPAAGGMARDAADAENDSRSGSDHLDAMSAGAGAEDEDDAEPGNPRKRKKRYHRHTPQQIQELEALFKECPHPDEKQRGELSKRLGLDPRQVKFWFQNRRTQMKTQLERHENALLKQENDKLRAENMAIREAMRSPMCGSCGSPAMLGEVSLEEQHLCIENARLKDELNRVYALATKFLGKPMPVLSGPMLQPNLSLPMPSSSLELAVGGLRGLGSIPSLDEFAGGVSSPLGTVITPARATGSAPPPMVGVDRSMLLELAISAMDELVKLAQRRWSDMFSCMIAKATVLEEVTSGIAGSRNGALLLMKAELQVLSPLVPIREVTFLRFCKQLAEGAWAVVDVSIDGLVRDHNSGTASNAGNIRCRRLPSGCVMQDTPNGYCKVTWVEYTEYDEASVHQLYRPLIRSGLAFGARRWLAMLQRQCECLAILMSPDTVSANDSSVITQEGKRSMLKLARRMTENFCAGVSASSAREWSKLDGAAGSIGEDVRVMARKSVDEPGEPPGVVLSAATSVWVPVAPEKLFNFLRDEQLRAEWDILSNGGPMQEMANIAKGQEHGNSVSLLRASAMSANQSSMLILQETCTDASGSMVVYAPVDIPAMQLVMNGGDSTYVALLPSGFAILPDGPSSVGAEHKTGGSLLTVAFQILVNSQPTAKLTVESVETVNNLIFCTIKKIKTALQCDA